MKVLLSLSLITLVLMGCGKQSEKAATIDQKLASDEVLCNKAAEKIMALFSKELKGELLAAMKEGGTANAVKVCRNRAPEIAAVHSQGSLVTIRRVSDKNRNPNNLATEEEMAVLVKLADTTDGSPSFMGQWTETDSGKTYQYYKSIKVSQLCLKCHGSPETLDPVVLAALKENYLNDKATGYEVGDLRGMFVVEMKWTEAKTLALNLLSDSL